MLSAIYELFMINYEAQNYKLFVDYTLILLKFTLAVHQKLIENSISA